MKKYISILAIIFCFVAKAQEKASTSTSNRFFYELTFKPGVKVDSLHKEMTILDIIPGKSIYQDYLMVSQDSILKIEVENMMKSGTYKDISKLIKQPRFTYSVTKLYPTMAVKYTDNLLQDRMSYEENVMFDWKITKSKEKVGDYNGQIATTTFGGREWKAWFSNDLPFPDGPYKFHGLPGLIVKIESEDKEFSWVLKGNKTVKDYSEESYSQQMMKRFGQGTKALTVDKEKFEKTYEAYRKDPFGAIRDQLSKIPADAKMPDGTSISQMVKEQEARTKKFLSENDNSIEIKSVKTK